MFNSKPTLVCSLTLISYPFGTQDTTTQVFDANVLLHENASVQSFFSAIPQVITTLLIRNFSLQHHAKLTDEFITLEFLKVLDGRITSLDLSIYSIFSMNDSQLMDQWHYLKTQ